MLAFTRSDYVKLSLFDARRVSESIAVIFDLDGVLVDSKEFHWESWQRLAPELDFPITREGFLKTFGMPNKGVIDGMSGRTFSESEISRIAKRKEELYREAIRGKFVGLPGAVELVRTLRQMKIPLAVGSSAPAENVELVLSELKIRDCFDAVVKDGDYKNGKPAPDVFLTAAKNLNVSPSQCIVIEDAVHGVEAAKAAGMKCIAVTTTTTAEALKGADLIIADLSDQRANHFLSHY